MTIRYGTLCRIHKPDNNDSAWTYGMNRFDGAERRVIYIHTFRTSGSYYEMGGCNSKDGKPYYFLKEWLEPIFEFDV